MRANESNEAFESSRPALKMAGSPQVGEFQVNISNSSFKNLLIGNGNTVNYCRCLEYPERSRARRSARKTAIQDGGHGMKHQSIIQFPKRKLRANPKRISSESEDDTMRLESPEIFPVVPRDGEQRTAKSLGKFFPVFNKLHPLRDAGNWSGFDQSIDILHRKNQADREIQILLSIENAVIKSYQNDLDQSEMIVLDALDNLYKTKVISPINYHFLVSMAHIHLTGIYRRLCKHGEAQKCIAIAEQYSQQVNSRFLKALIFYEMASNLTKYISTIRNDVLAREQLVSDATNYLKLCISLCIELDDDQVYIKKHHFALLKLALMALNCRTRPTRSQIISTKCVDEARNCLKTVDEKYMDEMSKAQKIQFLVAKSDLHFRQNNLQEAEIYGRDALNLAKTNGFSLEIPGITERLDDISNLRSRLTPEISVSHEEHLESMSSSTSPSRKNSPNSSDCDMDTL